MDEDIIYITPEDVEIIDFSEYTEDLTEYFNDVPDVSRHLVKGAKEAFSKIEKMLYSASAFINVVRTSVPEQAFQAIFTNDQKDKLASGALKLMTKKDGSLMANLVNPKTNKIISTISLQSVNLSPTLLQSMTSYASQMQIAQIAEQIQVVQLAIEEVRQGEEYDRLAMAYSCQQKLLQAMQIKNPDLKAMALLQIVSDAEDSRNLLMQSQNANLAFIKDQPESFFGKLLSGATPEKTNQRMNEIRESLSAVNMVSLVEAMAYQEMGESAAAKQSLQYYAGYLKKTYLSTDGLVQRLDLIDPAPENYWSKTLPEINKKIQALTCVENVLYSEGEDDGE
ncbi:MAG: hypothetical protein PUG43_00820 [Clostridiales bacterium]|uniref:hypothetical protein n=1 Tax=Parvimonas sp. TaxID=1944660 RepID=UPI002A762311|nr:hypothetical protein [Parvimonas sp.]MDD7347078.1 hypothetical protein [Clostridiales bacterium]MDY3050229.1 hypothetical protein [Parvimonas sp.]